ncbi:NADP-dependent oxidoreductase [Actinokineospora sp. NBRC 105648]|uniref:NADP-dependent oxidoreductase n=1 Tax=Actinokineospora sp. NBRC 105648 TaxID=3032206 RepID=UPI0024A1BE07|nr:NADP-dependent oxidoreductase [Actinokineospora sp. NBRC 105648]GLZ38252.1 NADP-dependent oxidoreductase [Actinokineospora sp. NBRC 105648]
MQGLEIHLAARPVGKPQPGDFDIVSVAVAEPGPGQVLVRNHVMSVDPYMRGRMNDAKSYAPPYEIGEPLHGGAVGEVVSTTVDSLRPGDFVLHELGWREYAIVDASQAVPVDPSLAPLSAYLGVLGMPGLTAYVGLLDIGSFRPNDTVFVSAAAGAVGSVVGQVARLRGAKRVIGSAGSDDKVRYLLDELRFDAAFNYRTAPVVEQLAAAAPDGIDLYFDNVGGHHLEAAIESLTLHGRVTVCGMISQYNAAEPPAAPRNLMKVVGKRLTIRGMLVRDHYDRRAEFLREVGAWVRSGELRYAETVVEGLRNAPTAFTDMLGGANTGKMLVSLV